MAEPLLGVRSSKARDLAHRFEHGENDPLSEIVELEVCEARAMYREPASVFYRRLFEESGTDLDLEEIILRERRCYCGVDLQSR